MAKRNPPWTRDELILALDLYFQENPLHTSQKNPKIVELSFVLNKLPVHTDRPQEELFRNPNGVYMKMCNYLRLDPSNEAAGLTAGGKLEKVVWKEFAGDRDRLSKVAAAIRAGIEVVSSQDVEKLGIDEDPDEEFPEGRVLTALHRRRERSRKVVRKKKEAVLAATGALCCEACDFDFVVQYGDLGHGFAECHHKTPVSELKNTRSTRLSDLAILCANCHRMIHRSRPILTVEGLRQLIK